LVETTKTSDIKRRKIQERNLLVRNSETHLLCNLIIITKKIGNKFVTFVIYTLQFSISKDGTDASNNLRTNSHRSSHKTAANSICNLKRQHCDSITA